MASSIGLAKYVPYDDLSIGFPDRYKDFWTRLISFSHFFSQHNPY